MPKQMATLLPSGRWALHEKTFSIDVLAHSSGTQACWGSIPYLRTCHSGEAGTPRQEDSRFGRHNVYGTAG